MTVAIIANLGPVLAQETGAGLANIGLIILIFVVFWFLLIRPQQRQAKRQKELVASLQSGDRVITVGGLHGTIRSLSDDTVSLEIAPGTLVTVVRQRIIGKVTEDDEIGETG